MATSTVAFATLHGETFDFWLPQSKNAKRETVQARGRHSLSPQVLFPNKTCIHAVAKELDAGGKANCHLFFFHSGAALFLIRKHIQPGLV